MRKLSLIIFIVLIFSLTAFGVTEEEFERICRSGSVDELKSVTAEEKNFADIRFHEMDTPLIVAVRKSSRPEF